MARKETTLGKRRGLGDKGLDGDFVSRIFQPFFPPPFFC
jgi:hypothetical protein